VYSAARYLLQFAINEAVAVPELEAGHTVTVKVAVADTVDPFSLPPPSGARLQKMATGRVRVAR
jgi:hypothetical protein